MHKVGYESIFEELYLLESIIKLTQESCLNKEISSKYYNLPMDLQKELSEERNNYINMLNIALDKLDNVKDYYFINEEKLTNYNSTPTIAADK